MCLYDQKERERERGKGIKKDSAAVSGTCTYTSTDIHRYWKTSCLLFCLPRSFKMLSLSKLLILSTAGIAAAGTVSGLSPTATLDAGVVVGTTTAFASSSTTVNKFLGVPFAAPPKRFEPAGNPEPWTQPLDTKNTSPACVQQFRCTFPSFLVISFSSFFCFCSFIHSIKKDQDMADAWDQIQRTSTTSP